MINKLHGFKAFNVITIFFLTAFLLTSCGGFSFQAQTAPAEDGGIAVTGGVDPILPGDSAQPAPAGQMMTPTTMILLLVGFGVLVLILLLLVRRPTADTSDKTPRIS